jgi:hypothetical protein
MPIWSVTPKPYPDQGIAGEGRAGGDLHRDDGVRRYRHRFGLLREVDRINEA